MNSEGSWSPIEREDILMSNDELNIMIRGCWVSLIDIGFLRKISESESRIVRSQDRWDSVRIL
jgi:hypothetical protein